MSRKFPMKGWQDSRVLREYAWREFAECAKYPALPWTVDMKPAWSDIDAMTAVCAQCPVRRECTAYAVDRHIDGGFYNGVWVPWRPETWTSENRRTQWLDAHAMLQRKLDAMPSPLIESKP